MRRLLAANLARLKKDRLFLVGMVLMPVYGICHLISEYRIGVSTQTGTYLEDMILGYAFIAGIVTAIFVSFFLGTEYGDGTIRNKLITGSSRYKVYFSSLITVFIAVLLLCFVYTAATLVVGIPLLGGLKLGIKEMILLFMGSVLLILAFCSVYTMLGMCCANKAVTVAVAITMAFVFFLSEAYIGSMLTVPDYWTGTKRAVMEFVFDFLPSGQAFQYMSTPVAHPYQKAVYALLITVATTSAGQILFGRKNIR